MLGVWLGMAQPGEGEGARATGQPATPTNAGPMCENSSGQSGLAAIAGPNHGICRRALLLRLQEMGI
jgi:hypothetical protein